MLLNKAWLLQADKNQQTLFPVSTRRSDLVLENTASRLLYSLILNNCNKLGLDEINDEIFKHLVIARIVEPVSKPDSIRVLEELGITCISKDQIYRSLLKTTRNDYRKIIR